MPEPKTKYLGTGGAAKAAEALKKSKARKKKRLEEILQEMSPYEYRKKRNKNRKY